MADFIDFIQQVKRANDIVDVIGSYIEVKQRGQNHWARCPFHGEKTPSFSISRKGQFYKCFGCGESGDVITFVEKYESCSMMEALEILAKRVNMKMPETAMQKQDSQLDAKRKLREKHLEILKATAVFYYKNLYAPQGKHALDYLHKRGFSAETIKRFGFGYSPNQEMLPSYLQKNGYSLADCVSAGVLQQSARGTYFDALFGRLIVPIFDINNKVIAFGGRALSEQQAKYGKYKNTSETPLFVKNRNLYGINVAKQQKQQANLPHVLVVEGYMDVIALYQAGVMQSVASMGTSLTEQQAKLISRLSDTVYICYDGDAAGQKATIRGMDILAKEGLDVKVMSVPDNQDPDEYVKKHGVDAFNNLLQQALPLADYKLKVLEQAFPLTGNQAQRNSNLAKYVKGAVIMLQQLDDVAQARYVTVVSKITGYSEEYLRRKLAQGQASAVIEQPTYDSTSSYDKALNYILACLLNNMPFAHLTQVPDTDKRFYSVMFNYVLDCQAKGQAPSVDMMFTLCPEADDGLHQAILQPQFSEETLQSDQAYYQDCVNYVEETRLKNQRNQLNAQLKTATDEQATQIIQQIQQLNEKLNKLNG
ncbi:MAG: DNA primase [Clostridia bacterium]|nr:DNA primase [Clostridia bacterium]